MKKLFAFIAVLMFWSVLSSASAQAEVTLRVGYFVGPQAASAQGFIEPWAQKIMEDSDGRIAVETFPGAQLASPPGTYDAIKDGVMDVGWGLPGYTPGRFPLTEVFEMPFMPASAEITSRAAWDMYEKHMQDSFPEVKMIAFHVHSPGLFHMKGDPVESLEDLRGRTIRAPTRAITQALTLLGAEVVGMPVPQVPEAVSRGVVEGTVLPYEITGALKLAELVDSHSSFEGSRAMYTSTFFFAMNKDVYDSMPEDLQAVIDANSGQDTSAWGGRAMDEADPAGIAAAEAEGNDFYTFTEAEKEKWLILTQPVVDDWIAVVDGAGFDGEALLEEAKMLIAKYEAEASQ